MRIAREVRKAVKHNAQDIIQKNNVVAVGSGREEKDGKKTGRDAVVVFVKKKLPIEELKAEDLVPRSFKEGNRDVPTDVIEVGEIRALNREHREEYRPVLPGTSLGHFDITAGTLGLVVLKNGVPFILSNNHVIANTNDADIGDAIYQPGPADGGKAKDTVAELSDFVEISFVGENLVDCALARITLDLDEGDNEPPVDPEPPVEPEPPVDPEPPKEDKKDIIEKLFERIENFFRKLFGRWRKKRKQEAQKVEIKSVRHVDPLAVKGTDFTNQPFNMETPITRQLGTVDVGDYLQKSGRTTGFTEGEVLAIDAVVNVSYDSGVARFEDQLLCSYMSKGGDSGSAVFDENGNLVGLLFAGSATVTICNKIQDVFDALGIDEIA